MPLTPFEDSLANFFEQHWLAESSIPSKAYLIEECGITEAQYNKTTRKPEFLSSLEARGLDISTFAPDDADALTTRFNGKGLTERQLVAANVMLDLEDNRSQKKKLNDINVSTGEWNAWLRDPAFQTYLRKRAEARLGDSLHEAHLSLIDRVRSGDVNAIKYFNEITGRYIPDRGTNSNSLDIKLIINKLLESVMKHVSSPAEQAAIADDLMAMAAAISMGNSISSIPTPQLAFSPSDLTPPEPM